MCAVEYALAMIDASWYPYILAPIAFLLKLVWKKVFDRFSHWSDNKSNQYTYVIILGFLSGLTMNSYLVSANELHSILTVSLINIILEILGPRS